MPLPDALKIGSLLPVSEVILVLFRPIIESLARLLPRAPGGNPHQSGLLDTFCVAEIWIHIQCNGTIRALSPRQVADLLGHSTSEITELYYVKKDTSRLAGITAGFDL